MIRTAALAALETARAAEEAARQAAHDDLVADASAAWDATMLDPDGKLLVPAKKLDVVHVDVDAGLVVLTDGTTAVAIRQGEARLAADDDGWTWVSGPLANLVDVGRALADREA